MKKLILIYIICNSFQILVGQTNIEKIWLTAYKGDSLIQERFLVGFIYDKENTHNRVLFDPNGNTTETVITYFDNNGNDSIEIWKYPNDTASYTIHWTYNDNNQLISKYTSWGDHSNHDTAIFQYDKERKLIKETILFKSFHPFDTLIYQNEILKEIISYTPNEISQKIKYKYNKNGQLRNVTIFNEKAQKLRKIFHSYDSNSRKTRIRTTRYKTNYSAKQIELIRNYKYSESGNLQELNIIDNKRHFNETIYYNENGEKIKLIRRDKITNEMTIEEFERLTLHKT